MLVVLVVFFFFFKQKTAYEMLISDWSSDVCSSDLNGPTGGGSRGSDRIQSRHTGLCGRCGRLGVRGRRCRARRQIVGPPRCRGEQCGRSEEHTSELQSLMRISYDVFCLKKKTNISNSTLMSSIAPSTRSTHHHNHPAANL